MTPPLPSRRLRRFDSVFKMAASDPSRWRSVFAAVLGAVVLCGCARIPSGVHIVSQQTGQRFEEKFPVALISRGAGGNYHVVLLKDGTRPWRPVEPGQPLPPLDLAAVRQIMHLHVFWQPMPGSKPDTPSATNAAIDWFLVHAAEDGTVAGVAHYEGAGFVTTSLADDQAGIIVRNATLQPTRIDGQIADPLGSFRLRARFDAIHRPDDVQHVLAELDKLKSDDPNLDAARLTQPAAVSAR